MTHIDDAYNKTLMVVFGEMLDRGIPVETLSQCISIPMSADPDLPTDEKKALLSVQGQAMRMLTCAYNVHTESQAEHWEGEINRLCGDEPPYSYTDHVGDA
jgi:hypothetical protein